MTSVPESSEDVSYASLLSDPRLVTVTLLSLVGTLGVNVASPALPSMSAGLGVSDARIGLVITAYTLPAMFMVPVAGALADLYGRRTIVVPALVLFGLAGSAIAAVDTFEAVLVLRGLQGLAFAGIMPLSVTILGDLYSGPTGSAAQGLRVGMNGLGSTVAPVVAGALSAIAWNHPFLLYAAALPVAAVAFVVLPETASGGAGSDGLRAQLGRYVDSLLREVRRPRLSALLAGGGVRDFVRYGLITFVPLFAVRSLGASFAVAGALLSLRGVAYILVSPGSGVLVGASSRRWVLVGGFGLAAASAAAMPLAPDVLWLGAFFLLYSVGDSVFSPVIKDAVTDASAPDSRAGVVGGMNVLKYAGQTAGPVFFGLVLAASGFGAVFGVGAAVLAVSAGALLLLLREGGSPDAGG